MRRSARVIIMAAVLAAVLPLAGLACNVSSSSASTCPGVPAPTTATTGAGPVPATMYSTNDLIPLTAVEAWDLSGHNQDTFSAMVQQLAEVSARNRGVVLADTAAAGTEIGQYAANAIKGNPNQLLYTAVDSGVISYKRHHPSPAGVGAGPALVGFSANQLMPLTVAEAWQLSGGDYNRFAGMVQTLAEVSADQRGIYIQDSRAMGTDIGKIIRQKIQADPNQLLYAAVDSALMDYNASHPSPVTP